MGGTWTGTLTMCSAPSAPCRFRCKLNKHQYFVVGRIRRRCEGARDCCYYAYYYYYYHSTLVGELSRSNREQYCLERTERVGYGCQCQPD